MAKLPELVNNNHKVCVICEGNEDCEYFKRLLELKVWNDTYDFSTVNAKSASNIPARFEDIFYNDRFEVILIFCDTDKHPHREYVQIKQKINAFLNKRKVAEKMIIYANPCTMQIILSHFGEVYLKNQGKKTNASIIEKYTGVKNYDAHKEQIRNICQKIFRSNYYDMKQRVEAINFCDTTSCSTNFIVFLNYFENADTTWINDIQKSLKSRD